MCHNFPWKLTKLRVKTRISIVFLNIQEIWWPVQKTRRFVLYLEDSRIIRESCHKHDVSPYLKLFIIPRAITNTILDSCSSWERKLCRNFNRTTAGWRASTCFSLSDKTKTKQRSNYVFQKMLDYKLRYLVKLCKPLRIFLSEIFRTAYSFLARTGGVIRMFTAFCNHTSDCKHAI